MTFADIFSIKREQRGFTKRVPKDPIAVLMGRISLGDDEYKLITEQRDVITGYSSTVKLPYAYVGLDAEPNFPNVNPAAAFVAPLLSRTHIRLFWAFTFYEFVDWKDRRRVGKIEWATDEVPLRAEDQLRELVDSITAKFFSFIEAPIKTRWGEPVGRISEA